LAWSACIRDQADHVAIAKLKRNVPLTDRHPEGLDGIFNDADADTLVTIIRSFNETVD
jgi:hypothetical protein